MNKLPGEQGAAGPTPYLDLGTVSLPLKPLGYVDSFLAKHKEEVLVEVVLAGRSLLMAMQSEQAQWWEEVETERYWHEHEEAIRDLFLKRLDGQIVTDLGCGAEPDKFQRFLARYSPAAYIGVDIHTP